MSGEGVVQLGGGCGGKDLKARTLSLEFSAQTLQYGSKTYSNGKERKGGFKRSRSKEYFKGSRSWEHRPHVLWVYGSKTHSMLRYWSN